MKEKEKDIDYDSEPVWYCNTCLSLHIINSSGEEKDIDGDVITCHCGDCGSGDILITGENGIYEVLELQRKNKYKK